MLVVERELETVGVQVRVPGPLRVPLLETVVERLARILGELDADTVSERLPRDVGELVVDRVPVVERETDREGRVVSEFVADVEGLRVPV